MRRGLCALGLAWLAVLPLRGAQAVQSDSQLWETFIFQPKLGNGFGFYLELQPRFGENMGRISELLVRPAVNYEFAPNWTFWLGYLWKAEYIPNRTSENRVWEQVQYSFKAAESWHGIEGASRLRLEERFQAGADAAVRLRYLLRVLKQIGQSSWYGLMANELFLNLNDVSPSARAGVDQNRFTAGVNVKFNPQVRMDVGYMLNFVNEPAPSEDRFNHNVILTMDWSPQ